jgi:hypothetical protein
MSEQERMPQNDDPTNQDAAVGHSEQTTNGEYLEAERTSTQAADRDTRKPKGLLVKPPMVNSQKLDGPPGRQLLPDSRDPRASSPRARCPIIAAAGTLSRAISSTTRKNRSQKPTTSSGKSSKALQAALPSRDRNSNRSGARAAMLPRRTCARRCSSIEHSLSGFSSARYQVSSKGKGPRRGPFSLHSDV